MLSIETVDYDSLSPNLSNPRLGDTDAIVESIEKNGVYRPIIVASDGVILAGHHLWYALGELGREKVDIVRLDYPHTDPRAKRVLLVDNRAADLGKYDESALVSLLLDLQADIGLIGTGYTDDALAELLTDSVEQDQRGFGAPHTVFTVVVDCPDEAMQSEVQDYLRRGGYTARAANY